MIVCSSNLILKEDLYNVCLTAVHKDAILSALLNQVQTFVHQYETAITSCQKCGMFNNFNGSRVSKNAFPL